MNFNLHKKEEPKAFLFCCDYFDFPSLFLFNSKKEPVTQIAKHWDWDKTTEKYFIEKMTFFMGMAECELAQQKTFINIYAFPEHWNRTEPNQTGVGNCVEKWNQNQNTTKSHSHYLSYMGASILKQMV